MLFPPCPQCGSKVESAASDRFEQSSRGASRWLSVQRATGHRHPYLHAATLAVVVGREIYKRVSGGGEKRCTAPTCGHIFR